MQTLEHCADWLRGYHDVAQLLFGFLLVLDSIEACARTLHLVGKEVSVYNLDFHLADIVVLHGPNVSNTSRTSSAPSCQTYVLDWGWTAATFPFRMYAGGDITYETSAEAEVATMRRLWSLLYVSREAWHRFQLMMAPDAVLGC